MSNSIKVVARFRPQNRIELDSGGLPIVKFENNDTCALDVSTFLLYLYIACDIPVDQTGSRRRRKDRLRSIAFLT